MSENFSTKKQKMEQDHSKYKKVKYDLSDSSCSWSSSDESVLSDDLIGNDSSDYNERAKFGGTYLSRKCMLNKNVQLNESKSFPESKFDWESPQDIHFSANSKYSKLTSTSFETQPPQENEQLQLSSGAQLQISKIGTMFSSFVQNSQLELQVLSNMIEAQSHSAVQNQTSSMNNLEEEKSAIVDDNTILSVELQSDYEFQSPNSESTIITYPIILESISHVMGSNVDPNPKAVNENEIAIQIINPNVNVNVPNDVVEVNMGDPNAAHVSTVDVGSVNNAPNVNEVEQVDPNATFDVANNVSTQQIKLPMTSIPEYNKVEALLFDEDVKAELNPDMPQADGLVKDLVPLSNEPESKYMNRTIEILFETNFFVDTVGWQTKDKRINIKNSFVLGCWKKSFETSFGQDEDNSKFMGHFRRYKSAKRAAKNKAANNEAANSKVDTKNKKNEPVKKK